MPKVLNKELRNVLAKALKPEPLWKGPYSDDKNGGITYSLLSRFLVCRHRFWIRTIKGLKQDEGFDYKMEYGNAWHYCEELLAANRTMGMILGGLKTYCIELAKRFPQSSAEVVKLYNSCKVQFPIYVEYWSKSGDVKKRKPVYQEEVFDEPYTLPDGRVIRLRGKWDAVDLLTNPKKVLGYYGQENKSKSDIQVEQLIRQLPFDLQSMLYIVTMRLHFAKIEKKPKPVHGIRYNVIRRPLSGFKYNIKQRKGMGKAKKGEETSEQFYTRLGEVIREASFDAKGKPKEHSDFFVRFTVDVTAQDVENFKKMVLNPVLTQLADWWDSIQGNPFDPWTMKRSHDDMVNDAPGLGATTRPNSHHWMFPSGVYNPALEGRAAAVDEMIQTGNERGFGRTENLFNELEVVPNA